MEIDHSFLNELCRSHMGWEPETIEKLQGLGQVNHVFKVQHRQPYILRCREGRAAYREYRKEQFCLDNAIRTGIPSSKTLRLGIHQNVAYMLQQFIPGRNGSLCPEQSGEIWSKLGEYAKKLHRIPVQGFGLDMQESGVFTNGFSPTLQRHIQYNMESLTSNDPLIELHVYPSHDGLRMKTLFAELLAADLTRGLVHGDLSAKNTILGDDGRVYLLDYGCAFCGVVPYDEIICVNGNTPAELSTFLQSYGFDTEDPQNMRLLLILSVLNAFDKARWALDYSPPDTRVYLNRAQEQYRRLSTIL